MLMQVVKTGQCTVSVPQNISCDLQECPHHYDFPNHLTSRTVTSFTELTRFTRSRFFAAPRNRQVLPNHSLILRVMLFCCLFEKATLSELKEIVTLVCSFFSASSSGDGKKSGTSLILPSGSALYRIRLLIDLLTLRPEYPAPIIRMRPERYVNRHRIQV